MEAMQKKRVLKTAKIHFAASVLLGLFFLRVAPSLATTKTHSQPDPAFVVCVFSFVVAFFILQPQFLLMPLLFAAIAQKHFSPGLADFFYYILPLVIAPFWSYAFAWIFIRAKDWLNHFPVLGRKVF